MNRRRHALLRNNENDINLFPFLSIFLCVMGVLSFLNLINAAIAPGKVNLVVGDVGRGYKSAYQILCLPDGMVAVPPVKKLPELQQALGVHGDKIARILQQRQTQRENLMEMPDDLASIAKEPEEEATLELLREINGINHQARKNGILYEEFILFGIYPDGGPVYHKIRYLLLEHPELGIGVGMEPLNADWRLSLSGD